MTELAVGGKRISLCAFNLWLGTRIHMVGYKTVQCSFKCDSLISDTEAFKDYSKTCFEKLLWLFVTKVPKWFFSSLKLFFFFCKTEKSGADPNLANPFFANLLLTLMTSKKHHHILKIELSLPMLPAQEHREACFLIFLNCLILSNAVP